MKMSTARDSTNGGGWGVGVGSLLTFIQLFRSPRKAGRVCPRLFVLSVPSRRDEQGANLACSRWSNTWIHPLIPWETRVAGHGLKGATSSH